MSNSSIYPVTELFGLFRDFATRTNGKESIQSDREWNGKGWNARVGSSRGSLFEKVGFTAINIFEGTISDKPGQVSLLEIVAYPKNLASPGFLLMTNMNRSEGRDDMLVLFVDLILQDGQSHPDAERKFKESLKLACDDYPQIYEESAKHVSNPELLGGTGAKCGVLAFMQPKDASLADTLVSAALSTYEQIISDLSNIGSDKILESDVYQTRARLVEWIIRGDFGFQVALENGIPLEVIEAYAFPPVIRY
jgi:hypothetical protein